MPLGSKDTPKQPTESKAPDASASTDAPAESPASASPTNPHQTLDPTLAETDPYADLDPTKVVGTYAMQPDPNDDRPAPLPNLHPGMKEAPADDEPGTPAIGDGSMS